MKMNPKVWISIWAVVVAAALVCIGYLTVKVDPFFHYHDPDTEKYFFTLNNQRSQNNGIVKRFSYDGMITGTSMTENFLASQAEELFGGTFIKTSFSGASFFEINNNMRVALENNPELKTVIRGLDMNRFIEGKDYIREDLGVYPDYLYDEKLLNDVQYVLNRDVFFGRVAPMILNSKSEGFEGGVTSFDKYSYWSSRFEYGKKVIYPDGITFSEYADPVPMTQDEREMLLENIRQNVTALAGEYPDVTFYYFLTPFSAGWWKSLLEEGTFEKQLEAERIVIEEVLQYDNIQLFSFNNLTGLTMDLNNFKDERHYGAWVNKVILERMAEGKDRLTKENYEAYLAEEEEFYSTYDYKQLKDQKDDKDDEKAKKRLKKYLKDK